ncbi:MAG: hypothetical protein P857_113 [Candidatus Xenolissoclinum pacificiensis L6]|uniref:tRNA threonylcarbamoyladenosine biosynthesis protein TsaE n=1 Tax=Candidatus Xenolissoclinum pacificiensis L6 TaxID=1401685 RepID=W2V0P9_9RICK|nr:MAG: hypothetical protein P857_113 [Candidatus Xenolissoclinum pacificiensis L6]
MKITCTEEKLKNTIIDLSYDIPKNSLILLYGTVGSGKTIIARTLIHSLTKSTETIQSPTFNLLHSYYTDFISIHHADLYRIKHPDEIVEIGLFDCINSNAITIIEWPNIIEHLLHNCYMRIHIEKTNIPEIRSVEIEYHYTFNNTTQDES